MSMQIDFNSHFGGFKQNCALRKLSIFEEIELRVRQILRPVPLRSLPNGQVFIATEGEGKSSECYVGIKRNGSFKQADNVLVIGGTFYICGGTHDFGFGPLLVGIPWGKPCLPIGIRFHENEAEKILGVSENA